MNLNLFQNKFLIFFSSTYLKDVPYIFLKFPLLSKVRMTTKLYRTKYVSFILQKSTKTFFLVGAIFFIKNQKYF